MYLKVECKNFGNCINQNSVACTHCTRNDYQFDIVDRYCANPCNSCNLGLVRSDCTDFDYRECCNRQNK